MLLYKAKYLKISIALTNSFFSWNGSVLKLSKKFLSRIVGQSSNEIKSSPPWRILFFGTDEFAVEHLKKLNENIIGSKYRVVQSLEVVTPQVNKCAVGEYAATNGLKRFKWPVAALEGNYDVGVVVSFGHLIPKRIIDAFPHGILNVHPSLLPRWRGASPIVHAILNGDRETGISVTEIRPSHFDVGPLLMQSKFIIPSDSTSLQLRDHLATEGSYMLLHALRELTTLEEMEYEQNQEGVTYAHKLTSTNARVNWEGQKLSEIDAQFRALSEIFDLRSLWNGHKVKLLDMVPLVEMQKLQDRLEGLAKSDSLMLRPGNARYLTSHDVLCIRCKDGWTGFRGIVLKKPLTARMFYNGYLSKPKLADIAFDSEVNELDKFIIKKIPTHDIKKTKLSNV